MKESNLPSFLLCGGNRIKVIKVMSLQGETIQKWWVEVKMGVEWEEMKSDYILK